MKKYLLLAALLLALALPAQAHTRDEVRAAYAALGDSPDASPYLSEPAVAAPYAEGELTDAAREDALGLLNFARWLAGLDAARLLPLYNFRCQHGAVLLAALDYVDHDAPRPADMDADFYDSAHTATAASNIAKLNWMRPGILREGVAYFLRDDGEENLPTLGHRRWALTPEMACTGFGLANAASGNTYVVMYAHDLGAEADWENVLWPAAGACQPCGTRRPLRPSTSNTTTTCGRPSTRSCAGPRPSPIGWTCWTSRNPPTPPTTTSSAAWRTTTSPASPR